MRAKIVSGIDRSSGPMRPCAGRVQCTAPGASPASLRLRLSDDPLPNTVQQFDGIVSYPAAQAPRLSGVRPGPIPPASMTHPASRHRDLLTTFNTWLRNALSVVSLDRTSKPGSGHCGSTVFRTGPGCCRP